MQGDRIDIGYIRDTIVIGQLKERGDRMKIVVIANERQTLEFSDLGDTSYSVEIKDRIGNILSKIVVSKEDIKRLAKAS